MNIPKHIEFKLKVASAFIKAIDENFAWAEKELESLTPEDLAKKEARAEMMELMAAMQDLRKMQEMYRSMEEAIENAAKKDDLKTSTSSRGQQSIGFIPLKEAA